jgi:hypothetical protein
MVTERGADTPGVPVMLEITDASGGFISKELTMTRSILISLAVLALSTSAALATQRTHHHRAVKPDASTAAVNPNPNARQMYPNTFASGGAASPAVWTGGVSSGDHGMYMKNLHDSGYDPKNNYDAKGILKTQ